MFNSRATSNIINTLLNNNNILSLYSKNLFNLVLSKNAGYNICYQDNQPFIGAVHDNPLSLSQNIQNIYINYNVDLAVFIHNTAPEALKKEDKYILSNKLKNVYKICFCEQVQNSWSFKENTHLVRYGIDIIKNKTKSKDIILFNLTKNPNIQTLSLYIKQANYNCDIITNVEDYEIAIDQISDYKIAICLENIYDALVSAACGCYVVSNQLNDNNFKSITYIDNLNSLIDIIKKIDIKKQQDIEDTKNYIAENYNLENFYANINDIFFNFNHKVYKYET